MRREKDAGEERLRSPAREENVPDDFSVDAASWLR
jgi:hypothetical protein